MGHITFCIPMNASGVAHGIKHGHGQARSVRRTAAAQPVNSHKAQQKRTFPVTEASPDKANNESIDRSNAARQNNSMLNKSALERAVDSVLKDNDIASDVKRETMTRAVVETVINMVGPDKIKKPIGRPNRAREDYDRLREIKFSEMQTLTPELLPIARRLVTVEFALRKSGVSDEILGERKQVRAARRLVSAYRYAAQQAQLKKLTQ